MRRNLKTTLFSALCGAFLFAATTSSWAGPLSLAIPSEDAGSPSLIQQATKYDPPSGKQCLKWTRRWSPAHGMGQRRCVHWK